MKKSLPNIGVCILALLWAACGGKPHLPDYVGSSETTIIEEVPSPRPDWTHTTITEDDEFFYFVGISDKNSTIEMAISSAFANGMKQILQYLGSRVNYRWEKRRIEERLQDQLNELNPPPDPKKINRLVENIGITGTAIVRKAKSTRTYFIRYVQDHRERVDACVEIRYPKEEERRLEYLNGLLKKAVLIPEEVDTLLPLIKILDMTSTPERDRRAFGNLLWLLDPSPDLDFSYFDNERTLAFLSSLDLDFLAHSLEVFEGEGLLSLEDWQVKDPQEGRLDIRMNEAGLEALEPIERLRTIDPESPIERIRMLADIPGSRREEDFLDETVRNKRDVIIRKAAEEDPLLYLDASQNMVMPAPEWSLDLLNMTELEPDIVETYDLGSDDITGAFDMLNDTLEQFYSTRIKGKRPDERDPEDYRVLTRILSKSMDLCVTSGLYKSRTFNMMESFLAGLSQRAHDEWATYWGLDRLDRWKDFYKNFQWAEIIADFNNGGYPEINDYTLEASLLLMKAYFWSRSETEMKESIAGILKWLDENPNLRIAEVVRPELMTFSSILLFESAVEDGDSTQLDTAMEWCTDECEDQPLGSSTRLMARSVFNLGETRIEEIIGETEDLFYGSGLNRPERVWTLWTLYRYLENEGANNALKVEFINWILNRMNQGENIRGLDRTRLLTLRDALRAQGPIVDLHYQGESPWLFRTTPWFSVDANAYFPHQVDSLRIFNISESKSYPIDNQVTGHITISQAIPLTKGWNPITLRVNDEIVSFLLVFYRPVEE